MMPASNPKLDDLLPKSLDSSQFNQVATELDLVAMAIAALTRVEQIEMRQVAQDLQVESIVSEWIDEWSSARFRSSRQLDFDQIRPVVLILSRLAQIHHTSIRQTIDYWQQTVQSDRLPLQSPPLADYLSNFITIYQVQVGREASQSMEVLSAAALTLLVDLLFYGGATGHQRLWGALLQRSE